MTGTMNILCKAAIIYSAALLHLILILMLTIISIMQLFTKYKTDFLSFALKNANNEDEC